jgi:hypothetical protein
MQMWQKCLGALTALSLIACSAQTPVSHHRNQHADSKPGVFDFYVLSLCGHSSSVMDIPRVRNARGGIWDSFCTDCGRSSLMAIRRTALPLPDLRIRRP